MVTLKQALETVKLFQEAYNKGIYNVDGAAFKREEDLRTKLAGAIARDNPPLDPYNAEDLRKVADLPHSILLSPIAEAIYKKYSAFLRKTFRIVNSATATPVSKPDHISCFDDMRETFRRLRQSSNIGAITSWRPEELTAMHRLCVRLANDNAMHSDEVMSRFTELEGLKINEASIYLAERLFEIMQR